MAGKMAAVELKHDTVTAEECAKRNSSVEISQTEQEPFRFRALHLLYYFLSFAFFSADLITDCIIFTMYLLEGHIIWGYSGMIFTILPASIIQMFSLRWHQSDDSISRVHWLLHLLLLGILHRYLVLISTAIHSLKSSKFVKDKTWVCRQESDIYMLHLFQSFMGAAPQLLLQLYIIMILHQAPLWTSISCTTSFCSLTWAIGSYLNAMHRMNLERGQSNWIGLGLQAFWRCGMMISRIGALVLLALYLRKWFPLCFGLHWLFMTVWVISQNTDFCPTVWEERVYNCIIGLIYCFDFYNLRVGRSRCRAFIFYSIIIVENCASLTLYTLYFKEPLEKNMLIVTTSIIIGGMILGLSCMFLYHGQYHPSKVTGSTQVLSRYNNPGTGPDAKKLATPRTLKLCYSNPLNALPRPLSDTQRSLVAEEPVTDKQFLLSNIAHHCEPLEDGIVNRSCSLERESVKINESSGQDIDRSTLEGRADTSEKETIAQKRRAICLGGTDSLNLEIEDVMSESLVCVSNLESPSRKRRGICSSLVLHMDEDLWKRSESTANVDVVEDLPRGKLRSPIVLEEVQVLPNVVDCQEQSTKPTTEFQQKDETMSCVTSIHDYENVCPLGVARPPWCIRSWKGYTDIETYIHDDSVVRDRRRDTLTSTTTGTTYSSEFSDVTCVSSILRGILTRQDDYLDTLTYDLIDTRDRRTNCSLDTEGKVLSGLDKPNSATVYIAKPIVIDDKGGMSGLDTIVEEHDETEKTIEHREYAPLNYESVSTLVSTIDQIRKYTVENSPRHVYHTTGTQWEDTLDPKNMADNSQLPRSLFKNDIRDTSRSNRIYRRSPGEDSESVLRGTCEIDAIRELVKYYAIESIKKTPLIDAILSDSPILGSRSKLQNQKVQSASNEENDLYVEMSPLVSIEKDNTAINYKDRPTGIPVISQNISDIAGRPVQCASSTVSTVNEISHQRRKKPAPYPKRKFSLLREKFEAKSQLVYVVTPSVGIKLEENADGLKKNCDITEKKHNKENLAPSPIFNIHCRDTDVSEVDNSNGKNNEISISITEKENTNERHSCNVSVNLKERRHMFLEQVLSPPKLLPWNKKKSFGSIVKN